MGCYSRWKKKRRPNKLAMSPLSSDVSNASFVRPDFFIISGFSGIPHTNYYYIFLGFVYALTVLGNTFVMLMILVNHCLHTPKYIVVFNLALSDLCVSSAVVPPVIDTFLFKSRLIPYASCVTSMFLFYTCLSVQSLTLAIMSFDRCVAICFPLRYNEIVTNKSMQGLTAMAWIFGFLANVIVVHFINELSFCKSIEINSYFCDYGPTYRLACNHKTENYVINWTHPVIVLWLPAFFIFVTYICIGSALLKIAKASERLKALKTCTSHLVLVSVFYFPLCVTIALDYSIEQNTRIINFSLATVLPPMLDPIIYSLTTEEFTESIKKLYQRIKIHIIDRNR